MTNRVLKVSKASIKKTIKFVAVFFVLFVPIGLALNWPESTPFNAYKLWGVLVAFSSSPLLYIWFSIMWVVFFISGYLEAENNA